MPPARRWAGLAVLLVGLPVLTGVLRTAEGLSLGSVLLLHLLLVVAVAAVGGPWPGLAAAVASTVTANWFFVPPYGTFRVEDEDSIVTLVVFLLVAGVVAVAMDVAGRARDRAARSRIEADLLAAVTAAPPEKLSLPAVLDQVRATFSMTSAALVGPGGQVLAAVGPADPEPPSLRVRTSAGLDLVAHGPRLFAEDRAVLERLGEAAARAWLSRDLSARADRLAETDRLRTALLAALGHDLRTPLAGLKAALGGLRSTDVTWTDDERDELLEMAEESTDRLDDLITNLLDMSRLEMGAVHVQSAAVALDEVVARALLAGPGVEVDVPDDLPPVRADPVLLGRVVANLVDNARRHSPPDRPVQVRAHAYRTLVRLQVVDHGPGVPAEDWPTMFEPFQRLGDRSGPGVGLGLSIVRGFAQAMGLEVRPSQTPGGGLTMGVELEVAGP